MKNYTHKWHKHQGPWKIILTLLGALACTALVMWLVVQGIYYLRDMELPETVMNSYPEFSYPEESSTIIVEESSVPEEESSEVVIKVPFEPKATPETNPDNFLESTAIYVDDELLEEEYAANKQIYMADGDSYALADGIFTFRGNNFRNNPVVGNVTMTEKKFDAESVWTVETTEMETPDGSIWSGNGWTGQPLMRCWTAEEKEYMNLYDWAKEKDSLVEVIYPSLDGYIYFLDLDTGEATRDAMYVGYTFKGAGALDPRGYPLLYVGSGYLSGDDEASKAFIISLVDCRILYTFGSWEENAPRMVPFFDSSALVCAETDQLIYPGENGMLYIMDLNTEYDPSAGIVDVDPDPIVQWTYTSKRDMWLGMEDSAVIYSHYLYVSDNGGNLICLDLDTLEPVWVQDVLDDTNCTPVLDIEEDGKAYIYTSTSFHANWRASEYETAEIPIWKIDAETGTIIWSVSYDCWTIPDVSGGVQGTLASGRDALKDYIYVPVSRTPDEMTGKLVAINKKTGEVAWEYDSAYSWSSPVCIYDQNGNGYVVIGDYDGKLSLLNGLTGELLDSMDLGSNIEASPAVYENRLVVGTRGMLIYGISFR